MSTAGMTKIPRRLYRDEGGQAIVFGAITMLFLVIAVIMVFQAGLLVDRRVQAQDAADAAAYSGACTKAMCVNSIEWLNSGMAYIYRKMLQYEYDSMYFSGASFTGEPADAANFANAYAQSSEWIERGTRWMQRIGHMEEGIANATPRLIEEEVYRVAAANGAQAVTLWPDAPEYEAFERREDSLNCSFRLIGGTYEQLIPKHVGSVDAYWIVEGSGNKWWGWSIESNNDYIVRLERNSRGGYPLPYFFFTMHDNEFANNGVNARDAVGVKIQGMDLYTTGHSLHLGIMGNFIYFYDGTSYAAKLSVRQVPGNPPQASVIISFGDGTEEAIDWQSLAKSGQVAVSHQYRYVNVQWTVRMWMNPASDIDMNIRADLDTVTLQYGDTYVESHPDHTTIQGRLYNGALSAYYTATWTEPVPPSEETPGGPVPMIGCVREYTYAVWEATVDGSGLTTSLNPWTTLYEDFVGIGQSGALPQFVEDTVPRFLNRGVWVPHGSIAPEFGRTLSSDKFAVSVQQGDVNKQITITQAKSWSAYGGGADYQAIDLARLPLPLSISEQFLRYGVNVGVWMAPEPTIAFFTHPPHGFFAVASADLGKRAVASGGMLTEPDNTLLRVWMPGDDRDYRSDVPYSYIKPYDNEAARWSAVVKQAPQGWWYAVLTPVKSTIIQDDLNGPAGSYASSAQMIFDKLVNSEWRNPATGAINDSIPQLLTEIQKPEYDVIIGREGEAEYYQVNDRPSPPFEYRGDDFEDAVQH